MLKQLTPEKLYAVDDDREHAHPRRRGRAERRATSGDCGVGEWQETGIDRKRRRQHDVERVREPSSGDEHVGAVVEWLEPRHDEEQSVSAREERLAVSDRKSPAPLMICDAMGSRRRPSRGWSSSGRLGCRGPPQRTGSRPSWTAAIFIGSDSGYLYSIDAATGCVHWSFQAQAGLRSTPMIGVVKRGALHRRRRSSATFAATRTPWMRPQASFCGKRESIRIRWPVLRPASRSMKGASTCRSPRSKSPSRRASTTLCCTIRGLVAVLDASTGKADLEDVHDS